MEDNNNKEEEEQEKEVNSFKELGICEELVKACENLEWTKPSKMEAEAISHALQGKDLIGLAQTGSGKTGAFALPILQALFENERRVPFFACVLSPTRELAIQIAEQFEALGSGIGVRCAVSKRLGALNKFKAGECFTLIHVLLIVSSCMFLWENFMGYAP